MGIRRQRDGTVRNSLRPGGGVPQSQPALSGYRSLGAALNRLVGAAHADFRLTVQALSSKILTERCATGRLASGLRACCRRRDPYMAGPKEDFILMMVGGLTLDPTTKMPIVVLKDPDNKLNLPIWIGPLEAASMATEIEGIKPQRPMTHDLCAISWASSARRSSGRDHRAARKYLLRAHRIEDPRGQRLAYRFATQSTRSRSPCGPSRRSTSPRRCSKSRASFTKPREQAKRRLGPESCQRFARQVVGNPREDVARRLQVQDVSAARACGRISSARALAAALSPIDGNVSLRSSREKSLSNPTIHQLSRSGDRVCLEQSDAGHSRRGGRSRFSSLFSACASTGNISSGWRRSSSTKQ